MPNLHEQLLDERESIAQTGRRSSERRSAERHSGERHSGERQGHEDAPLSTAMPTEGPFARMPESARPAAAIAVVAHFEASKRTPEAAEWLYNFEPFDWTLQDALGADTPQGFKAMQQKYGLYCIAPSQLKAEGVLLENMIGYCNKGRQGEVLPTRCAILASHAHAMHTPRTRCMHMHMPHEHAVCTCRMHMPHTHAKVPPSFYFIFTLKAEMITGCLKAHGKPTGSGPAADPAADPAAAVRSEPWQLIKLGPGAAGEMAPAEAHQWGSRQLLEWAKSREAQEAGLGLDQQALELFVRRVVTLFTEAYAHTTLKHGRLVEGGRVSMPLPQSCALLRAVDARFPRSLDIFDFSERHALRRAAEVCHLRNVEGVHMLWS